MVEYPTNTPVLPTQSPKFWGAWTASELIRAGLFAGSGFLMVLALWGTWFRVLGSSGNSFRMLNTADLLGLDEFALFRVFWFLIPLLYMLAMVACAARKFKVAIGLQIVIALPVGLVAAALLYVGLGAWGAAAATIAATSSIVMSVVLLAGVRRKRRVNLSKTH